MPEAATNEVGWKRGEHRKRAMVRMIVNVRPSSQVLPNGNYCTKGKNTILVYEDQVDEVKALVETETDKIQAAHQKFEKQLRGEVRKIHEADLQFMEPKAAEDFINEQVKELRKRTGLSPESIFTKDVDPEKPRAIKPLLSAEVIEENIPPPPKQDEFESLQGFSKQLSTVLAENNLRIAEMNAGQMEKLAKFIVEGLVKVKGSTPHPQ